MPLKHIPKIYRQNPRYQALFALDRVDKGSYSNLIVGDVITKANFSPEDANLFTELVYGTLAHKLTLRYQVGRFLQGNKKKLFQHNYSYRNYSLIFLILLYLNFNIIFIATKYLFQT